MTLKFDIAIPVYNEEATIEAQIKKLHRSLTELEDSNHQFQILIADNGSNDQTCEIAKSLVASLDRVNLISVGEKGVGLALRSAWKNSHADVVGYMDLDLATDLVHIEEVVLAFSKGDTDVINASRLLPTSTVLNRKLHRTITSRGLNLILRLIFKTRTSDAMCGFKFIKRETLKTVLVNGATSNGWFFATQILLVAEMMRFRVKEIPVFWTDDGNSKVKVLSLSKQYLSEIICLRSNMKKSEFRDFVRI